MCTTLDLPLTYSYDAGTAIRPDLFEGEVRNKN